MSYQHSHLEAICIPNFLMLLSIGISSFKSLHMKQDTFKALFTQAMFGSATSLILIILAHAVKIQMFLKISYLKFQINSAWWAIANVLKSFVAGKICRNQ